jgi:type VI secretion system protein ImpF
VREPRSSAGSRRGQPRLVQLPLLDRLIDEAPERDSDPPLMRDDVLDALRRSVQHDLEMLLNSRRRWRSWPAELRELNRSALAYGIPDCTAGSFHDKRERETLRAEIEDTLRRFEPRFARVRVSLVEGKDPLESTLRLQIEALLKVDPAPEPIGFETVLDASTADVIVRPTDV